MQPFWAKRKRTGQLTDLASGHIFWHLGASDLPIAHHGRLSFISCNSLNSKNVCPLAHMAVTDALRYNFDSKFSCWNLAEVVTRLGRNAFPLSARGLAFVTDEFWLICQGEMYRTYSHVGSLGIRSCSESVLFRLGFSGFPLSTA
jgi:hypothetical protein